MSRLLPVALLSSVIFLMLAAFALPAHAVTAAVGPTLSIDVAANRHAISDDIYGITFFYNNSNAQADLAFARAIHLPVNRHGGDATSRYNWKVDASNSAQDWFFTAGNGQSNPTPGASVDQLVSDNRSVGTKSIITIPIIEYINATAAWHCSFPQSRYGAQQSYNPYIHPNGDNCGNGRRTDGSNLTDTNPLATDILNQPSIQQAWVQHLVSRFGNAAHGGVAIYEMDNEPSGWLAEHRDVHPQGVGYTELRNQTIAYAAAVKAADPSAQVLGPGDIPYAAYDCNNCGNDGAAAHGGVPFGEWYLQQMAAYQQQHGVRLLDYYSMHYPGCCGGDPISMMVQRVHTFQGWINSAYPGTKLAFDEYNWGDASQFASALTTAEGLGTFGREGVDLASFWGLDNVTWPTGYAFRMFRDYDGQGSRYGDTWVNASSADSSQIAVFAAQRSSDGAITILAINTTTSAQSSRVNLANFTPAPSAQVFTYSAANPGAIQHAADQPISSGGFTATLPAQSLTLYVLHPAQGATPTPTPTSTKTATPTPASKTPTPGSHTPTASACPTATAHTTTTLHATATPCPVAATPNPNGQPDGGGNGGNGGGSNFFLILLPILLGGGGLLWLFLWRRRQSQTRTAPPVWRDAGTISSRGYSTPFDDFRPRWDDEAE